MGQADDIAPGCKISRGDVAVLADRISGVVLTPDDDRYRSECASFNTAADYSPAIVVGAASVEDIQVAVLFARGHDLPVAAINSGHGGPATINGGVLVTTRRMSGIEIDPERRQARVGAGVRWQQVVDAAVPHGLAPLVGSSGTVGVVGYALGGGLSPTMGRAFGWMSDHITALDVVTADGALRRVDPADDPELFWALRGARDSLGIVTAMEFALFPVTCLYGGALTFAGEHAEAVLTAYADLTAVAPDELTSSLAFLRGPAPGGQVGSSGHTLRVQVRVSWIGAVGEAEELLTRLRASAPVLLDTVEEIPYGDFARISSDPAEPLPFSERTLTLKPLSTGLVRELLAGVGPGEINEASVITLRHLGGALSRSDAPAAVRGGQFALWIIALGDTRDDVAASWAEHLSARLTPWLSPEKLVNFMSRVDLPADEVRAAFGPGTYRRLQQVKGAYDSENLFRASYDLRPHATDEPPGWPGTAPGINR